MSSKIQVHVWYCGACRRIHEYQENYSWYHDCPNCGGVMVFRGSRWIEMD